MHNRFSTVLAERFGLAKDRFPETEREIHQAEDALAKEMSRMSLVEQERILFDVHGIETTTPGDAASVGCSGESVASCDPESHLEDYLRRFDEEVRRVSTVDRTAYERAVYLDEDHVRGMRTTFLRASNFDALAAAEGMAKYFTHKRELFGDGILARDVRLSDLTDYELEHLESGYLQLLPSRDASGRAVIFMAPGYQPVSTPTCEEEGKVDEDAAFKSLIRAQWYFYSSVMQDEETQKAGVVFVIYHVGKYSRYMDLPFIQKMFQCYEGCPMKIAAMHSCHDSVSAKQYVTGFQLFLHQEDRSRNRPHISASREEIDFELRTFGIPTHDFPTNEVETLVLDRHNEWMKAQRAMEQSAKPSDDENGPIKLPRRFDVLFGRGRYTREHTGNLRAAHLVEMYQTRYEAANKFEKTEIAERVVAIIHESYGRFLKWEDGDSDGAAGWVEVPYDIARKKVAHFFRHLRSRQLKASNSSAGSSDGSSAGDSSSSSSSSDEDGSANQKGKARKTAPAVLSSPSSSKKFHQEEIDPPSVDLAFDVPTLRSVSPDASEGLPEQEPSNAAFRRVSIC